MRRSHMLVYGSLALVWAAVMVWQVLEHLRVRRLTEASQFSHARDVANSLAVVIRSQRRLGAVPRNRLVVALEDLAGSGELVGVALLSPAGTVVAAGGRALPEDIAGIAPGAFRRSPGLFIAAFLVELGPESPPPDRQWSETDKERAAGAVLWNPEELAPPPETPPDDHDAVQPPRPHGRWDRFRESHPFWQDSAHYRELYEKQGLHMMILMLDDTMPLALVRQDLLIRALLVGLALVALAGLGLAWRTLRRSTELEVRLEHIRATNDYLQELNLAAAGLAHETRNPLNVVRTATQLAAADEALPAPARGRLLEVIDEVDRITARLNEFIDYSRPREPVLAPVAALALARDVARTLGTDLEDKHLQFTCTGQDGQVLADATMLRQLLFNLVLNAVQAVPDGGRLEVRLDTAGATVALAVIDNGPGVPESAREDIFRPYFTLSAKGSGLGLAICRRIASAHGWTLQYQPAPGGGSIFSVTGMRTAPAPSTT